MDSSAQESETRLLEVFSYLKSSDRVIQDDTQLQKLDSYIETSVTNKETADSLLSKPEISSFLSHVANTKYRGPTRPLQQGLGLGSRLVGKSLSPSSVPFWEVSNEAIREVPSWMEDMFRTARDEEPWEQSSIRHTWIWGLRIICEFPVGLHWALTKGFLTGALDCAFDMSYLIQNMVELLLRRVLPQLFRANLEGPKDSPICKLSQEVSEKLFRLIKQSLTEAKDDDNDQKMKSALNIIHIICDNFESTSLNSTDSLTDDLLPLLKDALVLQKRDLMISAEIISTIVHAISLFEDQHSMEEKVEEFAIDLLRKGHIRFSMRLAAELLHRESCIHEGLLVDIVLLPTCLVLDKPLKNLDEKLVKKIDQRIRRKSEIKEFVLFSVGRSFSLTKSRQIDVAPTLECLLRATLCPADVNSVNWDDMKDKNILLHTNQRDRFLQEQLVCFFQNMLQSESDDKIPDPTNAHVVSKIFQDCVMLLKEPGLPAKLATKTIEFLSFTLLKLEENGLEWLTLVDQRPAREQLSAQPNLGEVSTPTDLSASDLFQQLAEQLFQSLCDIRWEVRDTAVVTLGNLVCQAKPGGRVITWLATHKAAVQIWQTVSDGESYVRAAAIKALTDLPRHPTLWEQLADFCPMDEIVKKLLEVLKEDTEAFARRSVVILLCQWLTDDTLPDHSKTIREAVNSSIHDLDWEVKRSVLKYWADVLQREVPGLEIPKYTEYECTYPCYLGYRYDDTITAKDMSANYKKTGQSECASGLAGTKHKHTEGQTNVHAVFSKLDEDGCLRCLVEGAKDYDQSVKNKACHILVKVRDFCVKEGLGEGSDSAGQGVAKRRKLEGGDKPNCLSDSPSGPDTATGSSVSKEDTQQETPKGPLTVQGFLHLLEELDIDQLLRDSGESTDDYDRNPESLFEDIVTSLSKDDDVNAVDCY